MMLSLMNKHHIEAEACPTLVGMMFMEKLNHLSRQVMAFKASWI